MAETTTSTEANGSVQSTTTTTTDTKDPATDSSTVTDTSGSTSEPTTTESTTDSSITAICKKLIPISGAVVVASIAIPLVKCALGGASDESDEEKEQEPVDEEKKQDSGEPFDLGKSISNFFDSISKSLNLKKAAPLSDGPAFTVCEFGTSQSS